MMSGLRSHANLAGDVIVVKEAPNSEAATVALAHNSACHLPNTLNSQLLTCLIWRGNEHLNANITSDRWAPCTGNKRSVERNIIGKATLCKLATIIPVEDYGEMQPVSHSGPASRGNLKLRIACND
jgi:hypothetical protein